MIDRIYDAFGRPLKAPTKEDLERILNQKNKSESGNGFNTNDLKNFTYVPELKLYVANEISMLKEKWYSCKKKLKEKGSRMLTPVEFWIYYDYCAKNKPDLFEKFFKSYCEDEWLDALMITANRCWGSRKKLILGSEVEGVTVSGGMIYNKQITKKQGRFERKDINAETGLPNIIKENGEFFYDDLNSGLRALVKKWNNYKRDIYFSFLKGPGDWDDWIGVREVKELKDISNQSKNSFQNLF